MPSTGWMENPKTTLLSPLAGPRIATLASSSRTHSDTLAGALLRSLVIEIAPALEMPAERVKL